jgi:hypothetical protein
MNQTAAAALLSAAMLSACGTPEGKFPSLSRRPFESTAPVVAPVAQLFAIADSLPPGIGGRVNALQAQHRSAQNAFAALLPSVRATANTAAGSAPGNENWVDAQLMISRLDKVRAGSTSASAEVDRLVSGQLDAESNGDTVSLISLLLPIQARIAADVTAQNVEIERLSRMVGQ